MEKQQLLAPGIQPLWESSYNGSEPDKQCHESLTGYGFLMYVGAMAELFGMAGDFGYTVAEFQALMKESAYPDYGQIGVPVFAGHFYDPDTGNNYNFSDKDTARTNGQKYYDTAVLEYNSGNRAEAIKNLGYSLHYLQDACEPHHASNKVNVPIFDTYNHAGFEELASKMLIDEGLLADADVAYDADFFAERLPKASVYLFTSLLPPQNRHIQLRLTKTM